MIRKIKPIDPTLLNKVMVLNRMVNISLSDSESAVLAELLSYSTGNALTLTPEITKQMRSNTSMAPSLFNTCMHRIEQKGAIKKEGKTIMLSPIYNNMENITGLLVEFK